MTGSSSTAAHPAIRGRVGFAVTRGAAVRDVRYCEAELCPAWTGHGCICEVVGQAPRRIVTSEERAELMEEGVPEGAFRLRIYGWEWLGSRG